MKKRLFVLLLAGLMLCTATAQAEEEQVWALVTSSGERLTSVCYEPEAGDSYISSDNRLYEVVRVEGDQALVEEKGAADMPDVSWLDAEAAWPGQRDGRSADRALLHPQRRKLSAYRRHVQR